MMPTPLISGQAGACWSLRLLSAEQGNAWAALYYGERALRHPLRPTAFNSGAFDDGAETRRLCPADCFAESALML